MKDLKVEEMCSTCQGKGVDGSGNLCSRCDGRGMF